MKTSNSVNQSRKRHSSKSSKIASVKQRAMFMLKKIWAVVNLVEPRTYALLKKNILPSPLFCLWFSSHVTVMFSGAMMTPAANSHSDMVLHMKKLRLDHSILHGQVKDLSAKS